MRKILTSVAVLTAVVFGATAAPASASPLPDPTSGARTATAVIAPNSITYREVKDGTLYAADMNPTLVQQFMNVPYNAVGAFQLKPNAVTLDKLAPEVTARIDAAPNLQKFHAAFPATTIVHIGGPYAANHTEVGKLTLPAGRWNVIVNAVTNRTADGNASDPLVRPQTQVLGAGAGAIVTIMGNDISRKTGRELMGNASGYYESDGSANNLTVNIFGYDDASGSTDSGILNTAVDLLAYRIGDVSPAASSGGSVAGLIPAVATAPASASAYHVPPITCATNSQCVFAFYGNGAGVGYWIARQASQPKGPWVRLTRVPGADNTEVAQIICAYEDSCVQAYYENQWGAGGYQIVRLTNGNDWYRETLVAGN